MTYRRDTAIRGSLRASRTKRSAPGWLRRRRNTWRIRVPHRPIYAGRVEHKGRRLWWLRRKSGKIRVGGRRRCMRSSRPNTDCLQDKPLERSARFDFYSAPSACCTDDAPALIDMRMDDPIPTFSHLVCQLAAKHPNLAYLHVVEGSSSRGDVRSPILLRIVS